MSAVPQQTGLNLDRAGLVALLVGAVGLAVFAVAAFVAPPEVKAQVFRSYLVPFFLCLGISLGSLVLLMIQYLTGGKWGLVLRRVLETGARSLYLMPILLLPVLLYGFQFIYGWAQYTYAAPDATIRHDEVLEHRALLMNPRTYWLVSAVAFAVWLGLAYLLNSWSRRQDAEGRPAIMGWCEALSGPGIVAFAITFFFASVYWAMSLETHWYSTIFPVWLALGQILSAWSFMVALVILLGSVPPLNRYLTRDRLRDFGSLLLAFTMIWGYLSISQYLLIYCANLQEEVPFYLKRFTHDRFFTGWILFGLTLMFGAFALPFLSLLVSDIKTSARRLQIVACWVLVMRFIDLYWFVMPSGDYRLEWVWVDAASLLGVGGVWLAFFLWQLKALPLIPRNDPRLEEGAHHG